LADAQLFLHVPDAGGGWVDDGDFEVFFHRHDVDDATGAGAERLGPRLLLLNLTAGLRSGPTTRPSRNLATGAGTTVMTIFL
jgi:hypothetical protein